MVLLQEKMETSIGSSNIRTRKFMIAIMNQQDRCHKRLLAEWPYEKKVFVLSSSPKQIPGTLNEKATLVALKPPALLSYLSDKRFSNIYVDGGKVIQSFLKEDLIDELIITKVPELIGSGIPLFGYLDNDLQFEHIQTNIYSDGLVKSHYIRKR